MFQSPNKSRSRPTSTGSGRQPWIEVAKGLGILIVVGYHVVGSFRFDGASATLLAINANWDARLRNSMSLFFFISGFLAIRTIRRSGVTFWRYLAGRLLYPYVLWSFISVFLSAHVASGGVNRDLRLTDVLLILWRPVLQYWFLLALAIYLLVSHVLVRLFASLNALLGVLPIVWCGLAVGIGVDGHFSRMLQLHLGFFCAGILGGGALVRFLERRDTGTLLALSLGGLAATAAIVRPSTGWPTWNLLPALAGFIPLLTLLPLALVVARHRPGSWLEYVGGRSLEIYVAHVIVAAAVRVAMFRLNIFFLPLHIAAGMLAGVLVPLALEAVVARYGLPSPFRLALRRPHSATPAARASRR